MATPKQAHKSTAVRTHALIDEVLLCGRASMEVNNSVTDLVDAKIKLVSQEGEVFEVTKRTAFMSLTVKNILNDADAGADMKVPLPVVDAATLSKVIEYCNFMKDKIDEHRNEEWEKRFIDLEDEAIFKIIIAANYMEIKQLLDLACEKVASEIRGKSVEQIRERFNLKNDYTPEEEEEVKREFTWCEE